MNHITKLLVIASISCSLSLATAAKGTEEEDVEPCVIGAFPVVATYEPTSISDDNKVTFQICRPDAQEVIVTSPDLRAVVPLRPPLFEMPLERDASGMWRGTLDSVLPAGSYRYGFRIDGVDAGDPQGLNWVPAWNGASPYFIVPSLEEGLTQWRADIPHGTVSEVKYWSEPLGMMRKAMVYTPPGYMAEAEHYPVLYLLHGATGTHHDWTALGNAAEILDNMIEQGMIKPMIVVMPSGHLPARDNVDFSDPTFMGRDLHGALIPYVEGNFRTINSPSSRAMAGLSMGGDHTIRFGLPRSDVFEYIGIFSIGIGFAMDVDGFRTDDAITHAYVDQNAAGLEAASEKLRYTYVAMGEDDFLRFSVAPLLEMLDDQSIAYTYNESEGGHDWINWRDYLIEFLPHLFAE